MLSPTFRKSTLRGFYLVGALPLGMLIAGAWSLLGGFEVHIESWQGMTGVFIGHFIMAWLWGRGLGRVTHQTHPERLAWAAAIAFAATTTIAVNRINHSEVILNRLLFQTKLPVHILFLYIFMAGNGAVVGVTGAALGLAKSDWKATLKLGGAGIVIGALTFLIVFLVMELFGFRVGAPGAEERATMLTVMVIGIWSTALVGSGIFGKILQDEREDDEANEEQGK